MDEFVCPRCSANLTQRQLLMTSVVTESCPHCKSVVRQGDAFRYENVQARTAEDVSGIDTWLAAECQQLQQTCDPIRGAEASGKYRWRITGNLLYGSPENWSIEAVYSTCAPDIVAVSIVAVEPILLADNLLQSFRPIFQDHGLQPHGSRNQLVGFTGSNQETRWGVQQHLSIGPLSQGLLRPVVVRLLAAMRDVMTTRRRQQS